MTKKLILLVVLLCGCGRLNYKLGPKVVYRGFDCNVYECNPYHTVVTLSYTDGLGCVRYIIVSKEELLAPK